MLAPLVYLSALKDPFRLPKLLASESLSLLSLVFLAAGWVSIPASARRVQAVWTAVAIATIASLGLVTSVHPAHVRAALPSLLIALAAAVGWSLGIPAAPCRRLLDWLLVPAAILAVVAILQFHQLYQPFVIDASEIDPRVRITSLAGNVADLAAYLVLPLLIGQVRLWEAWQARHGDARRRTSGARASRRPGHQPRLLWWSVASALCLYALLLTRTLTALAALGTSAFVLWLVLVERKRRYLGTAAIAGVMAGLLLLAGPLRSRGIEKLGELRRGEINNLLTGRLDGWRTGLFMMRERPLTGVGQGAFRAEFAPAKLALLERGVPFFERQRNAVFASAHDEAIEVAAEWGIPGLLAAIAAATLLARGARRLLAAATSPSQRGDAALASAGLACFATLAVTFFPFRLALTGYQAVLFFAWILAAALTAASGSGDEIARPAETARRSLNGGGRGRRLVALAIAALIAAAAVAHARRALEQVADSAMLQKVESATTLMIRSNRAVEAVLQANKRALLELRQREPSEPAVTIALGAQHYLMGRYDEAVDWYQKAIDLEPRPEAYFSRGLSQLRLGDRDAAIESFTLAVKLSPQLAAELPSGVRLGES